MARKLFCDIHPVCYKISTQKEIWKRRARDLVSGEAWAKTVLDQDLPNVVSQWSSHLIKRGPGIEPELQQNKAVNIEIACGHIHRMVIHPGEVFSFWRVVGPVSRHKGFKEGRCLVHGQGMLPRMGGGLCNLSNTIHRMVLHSPLEVVEFHKHSDALAPDEGARVPFSSGTSVGYNYIDYRFRNTTDQDVQLLLWCSDEILYGELRSEREFPWRYELVEEGHCFVREGERYFRVSKIYRNVIDRASGQVLEKQLVLDNHSEVMFDYSLIPKELIREGNEEPAAALRT